MPALGLEICCCKLAEFSLGSLVAEFSLSIVCLKVCRDYLYMMHCVSSSISMPLHFCVEEGVLAIKPVLSTSRLGHGPPCHLAGPTEQPQKRLK